MTEYCKAAHLMKGITEDFFHFLSVKEVAILEVATLEELLVSRRKFEALRRN